MEEVGLKKTGGLLPGLIFIYRERQVDYGVQCRVYSDSVQYTVYSVQCTVNSVQCTVYSWITPWERDVQVDYSVECRVYIVHCTLYMWITPWADIHTHGVHGL